MTRAATTRRSAAGPRPYRGMTADERHAERRERLLDAALDLFARDGYPQSPIEALCRRAGISTASFYDHATSREQLLRTTYDRIIDEVTGEVLAALDGPVREPAAQIRAGLDAFVRPFLADERKARINFVEAVGVSPAMEARRREVMRAFADVVAGSLHRLMDAGHLPRRRPGVFPMALVGATQEVLVDWVATDPAHRADPDELLDDLVALFVAAATRPERRPPG